MPHARASQFRIRANIGLLALAFVVILITSFVSVRSINDLRGALGWIGHTIKVKDRLAELQHEVGQMEVDGLRYMITGDDSHRDGLHRHLREIGEGIAALREQTADNPGQQQALSALSEDYAALQARAQASIRIREQDRAIGDDRAAIARIRDRKGEDIVDRMRARIAEMAAQENRILVTRQGERDALVKQTNATLLIANGLALFAGLIGFLALRRAQREAEHALRTELHAAQAHRASEEKSVFLASMSHEIRTPMNAIFGFAQLLSDQVREPLQREWVASIRKSGQMLLTLINDVLDLSKIEAGKLQLNPQGTDIAELTDEIVALFEPMAEAKRLTLRSEIEEEGLMPVAIDAQRLRQILMNLISNAVKYTERGEIVVSVSMRPSPLGTGHDLSLSVRDTGTGIDPEAQARIFEPFFQAESPDGRVRQGTGLGLSITRRLVDMMHGSIHLASRVGQGATFQVAIPDLQPAVPAAPAGAADGQETADFDRLPPLRILIVDDVEWNIEVAKGYLRNSHHTLAVARDGEEALAVARRFRPDAVMMDLRMPRMNGYRAFEAIRREETLRATRVIAVTASSLIDDQGGLQAIAFDGYIRKPYAPIELLNALLSLFGEAEPAATTETPAVADAAATPAADDGQSRAAALAEWTVIRGAPLDALRRRMRIREIGEFSRRLDVLAPRIGDPALIEEARRLHLAVQRFDAHQMKLVLDHLAADTGDTAQERPNDAQ